MSEVTRNTGFARGLFDAVEADSGKVKDKESKVAWLTKIIACVGLALGEHVRARPLKIVAGLEPEHTNAFLQQLARAASAGDAPDAVRRTLAGETFAGDNDNTAGAAPPSRREPPQREREPSPPRRREPSPPRARSPSPEAFAPPPPPHSDSDDELAPKTNASRTDPVDRSEPLKDQSGASTTRDRSPPPSSRRPPPRPQSARRAPPKLASNVVEVESGTSSRDGSRPGSVEGSRGGPAQLSTLNPNPKPPLANVLGEGDVADSDDDDESGEDASAPAPAIAAPSAGTAWDRASDIGGGALVRDMLAAKREGDAAAASAVGATTDEATAKAASGGGKGIILGSRRRSRKAAGGGGGGADDHPTGGSTGGVGGGVSAAMFRDDDDDAAGGTTEDDVEAIRERVQALVQFTNPLGKAMDALQEDVETMRRELAFWQRERENMGRIAQEVKSAPLGETVAKQDRRLEEADDEIAAMKKKIQSVKAAIHRNDDKIAKLLDMVVTPA